MIEANFAVLLPLLVEHDVDFIRIGGGAAIAHGAARATYDVDVVYGRSEANLHKLVAALADRSPHLRGAPPGLPFRWDYKTISRGLNFTLVTAVGEIDLLGEVTGGGSYEQLLPFTQSATVAGATCRVVTLEKLIELKRAAGRPKDFDALAELEALREEIEGGKR